MWYVLQVKSGTELSVRDRLMAYGYKSCVPQEARMTRKGGKWQTKDYILMPSYVFVELNYNADNYYRIKSIPNIIQWLHYGSTPSFLSCLEAEWLRALASSGAPLQPSQAEIQDDGTVHILSGVLAGFAGNIKSVDKHGKKVSVEVTVCGAPKTITLSIDY